MRSPDCGDGDKLMQNDPTIVFQSILINLGVAANIGQRMT